MKEILLLCIGIIVLAGCASTDYHYGTGRSEFDRLHSPDMPQQFIYGGGNKFFDASDWIWPGSWLAKLFLWNRKIDSHQISQTTVESMRKYLDANDLSNVQVLVNAYRPDNQWRRLFKNRTVGAGWRYTLGFLSVTYYTILPGRFFGGDAYNPYTNTIYLYSDVPAIALHEAGHSKDTGRRKYRGLHAALYGLPVAPLYYEACASNDALSYLQINEQFDDQKKAYKVLHPAYGSYIFGAVGGFVSDLPGLSLLGVIPGHITGNIAAVRIKESADDFEIIE